MELTQQQELEISRYISAVSDALAGRLADNQSDRALSRLRARIIEQISATDKAYPEDVDVQEVLRRMVAPENQADILARVWGGKTTLPVESAAEPGEPKDTEAETASSYKSLSERSALASPDKLSGGVAAIPPSTADAPATDETVGQREDFRAEPSRGVSAERRSRTSPEPQARKAATIPNRPVSPPVWLGVLAWCAAVLDWPVWALRILTVIIGLVTAPIALLVYMGAYLWLRVNGRIEGTMPLRPWRMFFRPVVTALMLIVIHFAGIYAIKAVRVLHENWLNRAMPDMAEWAWYDAEAGRMFFWALVLLAPLALFSAMPLANAWDYSIKRFVQACTALYAIAVSFGVASFISGLILAFVREFTGG